MAWGKAGSTTLTSSGSSVEATITASKFNQILNHVITAGTGNIGTRYRLNDDSGNNYAQRWSQDGAADGSAASQGQVFTEINDADEDRFQIGYICAISGEEKLGINFLIETATGAGTAPQRSETVFKYVPSPDAEVTSVKVMETVAGSFGSDTNLSVLGSDMTPSAAIPFAENAQVGSRAEITDTRKMYHYTSDNFSYDSKSFSVTSQDTVPQGMFFKPDGTKMYMVGRTNDTVYQYSLSTAWDISTASYDSVSFSVATQDVNPESISFKSDGTKMYMVGSTSDKVYQYTLSTSWDLSTTSYDSVSFSVSSQELTPQGMFFKSDGTKMYIVGYTNDTVYQYSLSSAWDLSTASYDSVSFSVGSQDTIPSGLSFTSNGTKMYIVGRTNDIIYQYTLSTAWDVSTASYDSISFSVTSQESSPQDIFFKSDDTKIYIVGYTNDTVYQYSLGNAWSEEGT